MAGGREHLELAVSLRALARQTDLPSARRALLDLAKRFDRMAARYGTMTGTPNGRPELQAHGAAAGALIVRGAERRETTSCTLSRGRAARPPP